MIETPMGNIELATITSVVALASIVLNVLQYIDIRKAGRRAQADLVSAWIDIKSKSLFLRNGSENPIRNIEVSFVTKVINSSETRANSSEIKSVRQIEIATVPPKHTYIHNSLPMPWESMTATPVVIVIFEDLKGRKWRQNQNGKVTALPSPLRLRTQAFWHRNRPFGKKMQYAMFTVSPGSDFDHDTGVWPPYEEEMKDADSIPKTSINDLVDVRDYSSEEGSTSAIPLAPHGVTFDVIQQTVHGLPGLPLFKFGYDAAGRIVEIILLNAQEQFPDASNKGQNIQLQAAKVDGRENARLIFDEDFLETHPREFSALVLKNPENMKIFGHAWFLPELKLAGITFYDIESLFHPDFVAAFGESAAD